MPFLTSQYYQQCMQADDFSTIVPSVASTQFAPVFYRATGFPQPAPAKQPCKQAKKTQTPTKTSPIRLRLTQPRPPPTGIKQRLRNPAARPEPIKIRLQNSAAQQKLKTLRPKPSSTRLWFFRNQDGKWGDATNDEEEAQWLREVFACARWIKGVEESRPTRPLGCGARMLREEEESWQKDLSGWDAELRPEDALGE